MDWHGFCCAAVLPVSAFQRDAVVSDFAHDPISRARNCHVCCLEPGQKASERSETIERGSVSGEAGLGRKKSAQGLHGTAKTSRTATPNGSACQPDLRLTRRGRRARVSGKRGSSKRKSRFSTVRARTLIKQSKAIVQPDAQDRRLSDGLNSSLRGAEDEQGYSMGR